MAKFPGMKYTQTSALNGTKVEDAFRLMVEQHEKGASANNTGL
jgi:hypothetical protein